MLPVRTAYLDGEAVVEHRGIADFGALQQSPRAPPATHSCSPSTSFRRRLPAQGSCSATLRSVNLCCNGGRDKRSVAAAVAQQAPPSTSASRLDPIDTCAA